MGKVKLNDLVRHDSEVTTIAELDGKGLIIFRKTDKFMTRKGNLTTRYFADIIVESDSEKKEYNGWEIGKFAYESRTKGKVEVKGV